MWGGGFSNRGKGLGKVQCPTEIPRGGKGRAVWGQTCRSPKWHRINSFGTTFRENILKHNPIIYLNEGRKIYSIIPEKPQASRVSFYVFVKLIF